MGSIIINFNRKVVCDETVRLNTNILVNFELYCLSIFKLNFVGPVQYSAIHASKLHYYFMSLRIFMFSLYAAWWRSYLRHCATSRKIAGSIPDGVPGIFH